MLGQALMLTDEDMRDLAIYFSGLTAATKVVADPATLDHGQRLYRGGSRENQTPACIACHGPNGRGDPAASFPSLKGQYADYIAKQLREYASGKRRSDGATRVMRDIAAKLSEEDIVAVSSYVQGLQ
jgi:cytochrome c553